MSVCLLVEWGVYDNVIRGAVCTKKENFNLMDQLGPTFVVVKGQDVRLHFTSTFIQTVLNSPSTVDHSTFLEPVLIFVRRIDVGCIYFKPMLNFL